MGLSACLLYSDITTVIKVLPTKNSAPANGDKSIFL